MAKLVFRYGAMGSSKTANALMTAYNYRERGKRVLLAKPSIDTRDGAGVMTSRIGLSAPCISVEELRTRDEDELRSYDCIIVDEAQFCTKADVAFFCEVADDLDVSVICYGLRSDFRREPFEGSLWLLVWADVIEEVTCVCWCGSDASCVARIGADGEMVTEGDQVQIGGNDTYTSLCRRHHRKRMLRLR